MSQNIKVGSWTNHGRVLFIDNISDLVPDPLCRMSTTKRCSHRLSELILVDKPQEEIEKESKLKRLMKDKNFLLKQIRDIDLEIDEIKET